MVTVETDIVKESFQDAFLLSDNQITCLINRQDLSEIFF